MKSPSSTEQHIILFRTDASSNIGTGHLMRCIAIAEICIENNLDIVFAMSECPAPLKTLLSQNGMDFRILNSATSVEELHTLTQQIKPKGIVIDGYQFNESYRHRLSDLDIPIMAMDDGTSRHPLYANIVLNSSLLARPEDYQEIAPGAQLLLGPGYVPLRKEFRKCDALTSRPDESSRILVTFGGSDPLNLTGDTLQALLEILPKQICFDVVLGGANPCISSMEALAKAHGERVQLHVNTSRMADLMRHVGMAISAAGSTLWELAYFGIPTIAVVVANNQANVLRPPLNNCFIPIDAREEQRKAIPQVTALCEKIWFDKSAKTELHKTLKKLNVGEKAITICSAFDKVYHKAS